MTKPTMTPSDQLIESQVRQWLAEVVIGLNLCPFAAKPFQDKQIRFQISHCHDEACLLEALQSELSLLALKPTTELETTLLIIPEMLADFDRYNQFLNLVDALIEQQQWQGIFQVATFHPNYQFGGTLPEDDENLTNRSPYPILHLIREASLERVLKHYPNPEAIPEQNIERVQSLTLAEKKRLFPYLFSNDT